MSAPGVVGTAPSVPPVRYCRLRGLRRFAGLVGQPGHPRRGQNSARCPSTRRRPCRLPSRLPCRQPRRRAQAPGAGSGAALHAAQGHGVHAGGHARRRGWLLARGAARASAPSTRRASRAVVAPGPAAGAGRLRGPGAPGSTAAPGCSSIPGSPAFANLLLRAGPAAPVREMHPTDHRILEAFVGGRPNTQVTLGDGFAAIRSELPPPGSRRGVLLVDPSYELKSDYAQVVGALREASNALPTAW